MHIFMATRGQIWDSERMMKELASKYLPWSFDNNPCSIELGVQPIQLWSITFPEEHLDLMLSTLFNESETNFKGEAPDPKFNMALWLLRKSAGLQEMPEYQKLPKLPVYQQNVSKWFIGIKPDRKQPTHIEEKQKENEML